MGNVKRVKEKVMSKNDEDKLKPEQIESWRQVLCVTLGPYALIMPDAEVQEIRDKMQKYVDVKGNEDG